MTIACDNQSIIEHIKTNGDSGECEDINHKTETNENPKTKWA